MRSDCCDYPSPRISHPTSVSHGRGHWFEPSTAHHPKRSVTRAVAAIAGRPPLWKQLGVLARHVRSIVPERCEVRDNVTPDFASHRGPDPCRRSVVKPGPDARVRDFVDESLEVRPAVRNTGGRGAREAELRKFAESPG